MTVPGFVGGAPSGNPGNGEEDPWDIDSVGEEEAVNQNAAIRHLVDGRVHWMVTRDSGAMFMEGIQPDESSAREQIQIALEDLGDDEMPSDNPTKPSATGGRHYTEKERAAIYATPDFKAWWRKRGDTVGRTLGHSKLHAYMTDVGKKAEERDTKWSGPTDVTDRKGVDVPGRRASLLKIAREAENPGHDFEVVVGNIGTVHSGTDRKEAEKVYKEYVDQAKTGKGRAGNETVVLFSDGEPIMEHGDAEENPNWKMERRKKFRESTGADTTKTPEPHTRSRFWVPAHTRDGHHVEGHYRDATGNPLPLAALAAPAIAGAVAPVVGQAVGAAAPVVGQVAGQAGEVAQSQAGQQVLAATAPGIGQVASGAGAAYSGVGQAVGDVAGAAGSVGKTYSSALGVSQSATGAASGVVDAVGERVAGLIKGKEKKAKKNPPDVRCNPLKTPTTTPTSARRAVGRLKAKWRDATNDGDKARLSQAAANALKRARAAVHRKRSPLSETEKQKKVKVGRIYRDFLKDHQVGRFNPPLEEAFAWLDEFDVDKTPSVPVPATHIPTPMENPKVSEDVNAPKEAPATTGETPAENPAEPPAPVTEPVATPVAEEPKQENPPVPAAPPATEVAVVNPPTCRHDGHLIKVGEGKTNPGGEPVTVFRCFQCKKTVIRRK